MGGESRYKYQDFPPEYNSWILFRALVDTILLNDFVAYFLFAISFYETPPNGYDWLSFLRFLGGFLMILVNVWVKADALRVVGDFAWYWGDFFFLKSGNLTFDGVFELVPHPSESQALIHYFLLP